MTLHHGDRVRMGGFDGPRGIVLRCQKRTGAGHYFKVKLDNGSWVWPDGAVVDSAGTYELTCHDCAGPFRANHLATPLCPNCEQRDERAHISEATRSLRASLHGSHTPRPRPIERSAVDVTRQGPSGEFSDDDIPF
jgi:hypothetical protein